MDENSNEQQNPAGNAGDYDADSIKVLEGMEAVRKRPGMYIGDPATTGLYQCIWETVDNSIDEAMAGFCDRVTVKIHTDNSFLSAIMGAASPSVRTPPPVSQPWAVLTVLYAGSRKQSQSFRRLHGW